MTTSGVGGAGAPLVPVRVSPRTEVDGTAVVRPIAPVHPPIDPLVPDLTRGGVDLPALLDRGADALVVREQPGTTALSELLERARGAMVRGAPMEVLAALDGGWEGAARTESGWYFRAAALTLLGLPGEAERVLQQAVGVRDRSVALAFLHSVVRSVSGQSAEARAALVDALAMRPTEPLLHAWDAVLLARSGHGGRAQAMLGELGGGGHNDAVLAWARQAIAKAGADDRRAARLAEPMARGARAAPPPVTADGTDSMATHDPVDASLLRIGARFAEASRGELLDAVRLLMQSLSATGALQDAGRSERSHAVRAVLASVLHLLGPSAEDMEIAFAPPPGTAVERSARERAAPPLRGALDAYADAEGSWRLTPASVRGIAPDAVASAMGGVPPIRRALLEALRSGRPAEAESLLAQARASEGEGVLRVLRGLVDGATGRGEPRSGSPGGRGPDVESGPIPQLTAARDDALLAPMRFGLILLPELPLRRETRGVRGVATPADAVHPVSRYEPSGTARRAATGAAGQLRRTLGGACLLLAVVAVALGHGTVALLLAGGASWLLLR